MDNTIFKINEDSNGILKITLKNKKRGRFMNQQQKYILNLFLILLLLKFLRVNMYLSS